MTDQRTHQEPRLATSNVDVLSAIRKRRSIRRYSGEPVSKEQLDTILHAGLCAPTARNLRPFHFIVIQDRDRLEKLAQGKVHARMLAGAACGIAICGDKTVEERMEHLYADCFAATQNILLAVHGLELGGVWLGVTKDSEWYRLIRETLELPEHIEPAAVVSIGHPAEQRPTPHTWEESKIHYETWSAQ
ncbi:MAG: nitroreductase family protein [Firmicutes bacterium]|mgnify:CR=1 FL=1|nr:nitroreductase family protein [Bacillota bacterium]